VRKFLSIFGGSTRRKASPAPGFGNIDLRSLAGSMTTRDEAGKLNGQIPKKPVRPAPVPDGAAPRAHQAGPNQAGYLPRRREEPMPESPMPTRRPIPAEAREARAPESRAPEARAPERAPAAPGRVPAGRGPQGRDDGFARQVPREGYLATHGLEKSFGGRKVVRGPSIYVRRGEAVGLLGPNGAGKTTVFYMITGLIKPDRGRIELDGHDVTRLPMYQRARLGIGYLPQEASIFRGLNVEENIRAVLEVTEPNRRKREADLNSLLAEFGLTKLRKSPSLALSGGERRRCEIARALATRPNYMLLDEPFAGIDPIAVGDIKTLVRHLTNRGIGVLITDHNVRETLALTDRAYIIYSGEVLREGRAADIVNDPEVRRLYLGEEFRM
jgi:lipopolysaccharide export system ATP-binding protein